MTSQHTPFAPQDDPTPTTHADPVEDDFDHSAPLLGPSGPVSQSPSQPLRMNVVLGTASLAQIGIWALMLTVWYTIIFVADWIFFSFHPVRSMPQTTVLQRTLTRTTVLEFGSVALNHEFCLITPTNPRT